MAGMLPSLPSAGRQPRSGTAPEGWTRLDNSMDTLPLAQDGGGTSPPLTEQVRQQAGVAMEKTRQATGQAVDQVGDQLRSRAAEQKNRATDHLRSVAQALHQTGEQLRSQGQEPVS